MARRFLTAEDVLRANAAEIVVDEGTVVTPQALEVAAQRGVAIRAGGGAWKEPAPDRGPDSENTRQRLPHLPEPHDNPSLESTAIVTAVGKNRPGVLAAITAAIAEHKGNVNDVSQKVVEGYFHMILTVELEPGASFDAFKTALECLSSPEDFAVRVMNERIFRFMHRV
jgi:ACT domain-containing protein